MTKSEIKEVVRDFLEDKVDRSTSLDDLFETMGGCAYWTEKKMIRKEMLVRHLGYQCKQFNGGIDEKELQECCEIFRTKILMV